MISFNGSTKSATTGSVTTNSDWESLTETIPSRVTSGKKQSVLMRLNSLLSLRNRQLKGTKLQKWYRHPTQKTRQRKVLNK